MGDGDAHNILTGHMNGKPTTRVQDVTKQSKLIDHFAKVNDNYTIIKCQNGFVVCVSGQDTSEEWINDKFVFKTIDELVKMLIDSVIFLSYKI